MDWKLRFAARMMFDIATCGLLGATMLAVPAAAQLRGTDSDAAPPRTAIYRIKPSEVPAPDGAKPGDYRRIIQPFGAWTLICDENLKARTKVCNAAQTIVDDRGRLAFSWSLAATKDGAPVFVLRASIVDAPAHAVLITFGADRADPVALPTCDASLCVGLLPVTAGLRRHINEHAAVVIQMLGHPDGAPAVAETTFEGLGEAIAGIR